MNFFQNLFSSDGFMPHGHCYLWQPGMVWLHVVSDSLITLAYSSIPFTLVYFIHKRRDLPFNWMFVCFAVFIVACGTTHLMEIWTIWHPTYWLAGAIKAITALASVPTAILLVKLVPRALALPSPTALQNALEVKNRFLANMSHELRTPLNGIIGFAEFLVDGKPGQLNAKQKEYLGDILNSGTHLHQLINDLLDLAKVEAGDMELELETFALARTIDEVCAAARPMADKKNIRVDVALAPDLGNVTLDRQKFKQVLYSLISNAVKFTANGGKVDILAAAHSRDHFKLLIRDIGIGKPEDLSRLFTEFEPLESGISRRHEGSGLGLALTRRIIQLQGGTIRVESKAGKGSTFTVTLPMVCTEPAKQTEEECQFAMAPERS